jgi:hypothetical protein
MSLCSMSLMLGLTNKPFMLSANMPNVVMLSVVMLNVVMLNVVMLNVIILSVLAPTGSIDLATSIQ